MAKKKRRDTQWCLWGSATDPRLLLLRQRQRQRRNVPLIVAVPRTYDNRSYFCIPGHHHRGICPAHGSPSFEIAIWSARRHSPARPDPLPRSVVTCVFCINLWVYCGRTLSEDQQYFQRYLTCNQTFRQTKNNQRTAPRFDLIIRKIRTINCQKESQAHP